MNFYNDNNIFDEITYSGDVNLIKNVSHFRHFINCFGVNKIKSHFKFNNNFINDVFNYCKGGDLIKEINEELIKQRKDERKKRDLRVLKNTELIYILKNKRNTFCNIGTNKIKRRLNKLSKTDCIAKAIRLLLEIEDKNIQAKDSYFKYKNKIYNEKQELIHELINLCVEHKFNFGKQVSDVIETSYIVYFEIDSCKQISFHTNLKNPNIIPDYPKEWDGLENSTLNKLEEYILLKYPEICK